MLGAATRAVAPKVTERASPAPKSRCAAIGRLFVRAILSLCLGFAASILALSVSSPCSSPAPPEGEPLACRSGSPSYNLSVCFADSSPSRGASGGTVHFAGPAKASPFGRGVTEGDGEGKPGRKEPLRSDGQALCQSDAIAVPELFGSGLALSVSLRSPAPPKGEPLACRSAFVWTLKARRGAKGRALLQRPAASGQRTLSSCRWPRQRSTTVSETSCFARPVESYPACQGLSLWESCPACGVTEKPP